jgi:adenylate kinase family enzyme
MLLCIIGAPGSGKTTLSHSLATRYGFKHVSAGNVARQLAESDPEVAAALAVGELAPRQKMNTAMAAIIEDAQGNNLVIDGFPRYEEQLAVLKGKDVKHIIVGASFDECRERLAKRARYDDTPENVQKRLDTYATETEPVISALLEDDQCDFVVGLTPQDVFNEACGFLSSWNVFPATTNNAL